MKKTLVLSFANALIALSLGLGVGARAQEAKPGDVAAGEKKIAMCEGCHNLPRYQASFPEIYKVPMIAGQNAKYIAARSPAIARASASTRRCAPSPAASPIRTSPTSRPTTRSSAARRARRRRPRPAASAAPAHEPPPQVAALLTKGNCVSCHGSNFSAPIDPSYPKLAGQHADYLFVALKAYQTDHNPLMGRNNAIMMGWRGRSRTLRSRRSRRISARCRATSRPFSSRASARS
jgi:cytochrome c553